MPFKHAAFTVMMPEYTLPEAAKLLARLGYDGVEWRVHSVANPMSEQADFWRSNKATVDIETITDKADEVRKISQDHGLEIICLGTYLSCKMLDDVERCMEAARTMDCRSIRVSAPKYDSSANYHDLYEEAVDGYARVEDLAREYGVRANVELHMGNICCSASLAYRFVCNFDPDFVGAIFDPGNMAVEGHENWQMGLDILGPYLSHVHVKNTAWVEDGTEGDGTKRWSSVAVPVREGVVSWHQVIGALDRVGYQGWLSVEDFAPGKTEAKLAADVAYLKSIASSLGIQ